MLKICPSGLPLGLLLRGNRYSGTWHQASVNVQCPQWARGAPFGKVAPKQQRGALPRQVPLPRSATASNHQTLPTGLGWGAALVLQLLRCAG